MVEYSLTWITSHLALGYAPMSYDELDSLKQQGINGIVNLCGEFTDLHEIEKSAGFEVFWLPIDDENAPDMVAMEKGLEWLDEAVYLGKKVLVHCRHGIGRTGTFVTAYLLRRGFSLKKAGKLLKKTRANPSNFSQWWLLRKFGKKEKQLTISEPDLDNHRSRSDVLAMFFVRYEAVLAEADKYEGQSSFCCGSAENRCSDSLDLELVEALYLQDKINIRLDREVRSQLISDTGVTKKIGQGMYCPLHREQTCLLHSFRPLHCRLNIGGVPEEKKMSLLAQLEALSVEVCREVFGGENCVHPPKVKIGDVVSGRFIQKYFQYLAELRNA
jgi:protein-tyrosine phosphatase